jgi:hypothetical protein
MKVKLARECQLAGHATSAFKALSMSYGMQVFGHWLADVRFKQREAG